MQEREFLLVGEICRESRIKEEAGWSDHREDQVRETFSATGLERARKYAEAILVGKLGFGEWFTGDLVRKDDDLRVTEFSRSNTFKGFDQKLGFPPH